ncbi:ABC transporter ATP-binding protein [Inconstantimicrobium mannanitabidum]|uniref:ABC transporter ATP-binding protein n=1 Tax=Inconstantimicrobium mannanitabidum TaxID=1604901 RepID=A0ACB5RFS8_9CLOT|nr:ABC transporter ATP-binding protein [Clostridium sp. TW13]GKX67947.1 ABC transporter ATP-binding protein [Clostridium sp. TW13]
MKYSLFKNMVYVYRRVFNFNKKLRFQIPLEMLSEILIPIMATVIPAIAVGLITDKASIQEFLLVMGGVTVLNAILLYLKQYLFTVIDMENTLARIQEFFFENSKKLMKTDYPNVEPQDKQILIQKAINSFSTNWVGIEFMMKSTPKFFVNIVGLITYGAMISSLNYIIIIILILMAVLNFILASYARNYDEKHKEDYVKYDRKIDYLYKNSTSLINGKDARIYKMETWFYNVFQQLIKKRVTWNKRVEYRYFLPSLSDNILLFIRDIVAYSMLISMVLDKEISVFTFTLFVGVIAGFSSWLNESVTAYSNLKRANMGVNDYRAYEEISEVFNHANGCEVPKPSDFPLTIEFKDVSFRYPGAERDTISNLNLKINGGSKIALVGNNGAGKTTLVKLLSGLYYPTEGKILVNGKSIKDYDIEEYYKLIGVVFQDVEVLAFTIAKNVAACEESMIDYSRINKCLELAGLKDKVDSLKDKEKTYITQSLNKDGILLSGGQMQRMMLARALYKNAPIIILDEPTSALDPIAESELYEKYNELTEDKTSLFISHRLASTKFCTRILFFENGKVAEDGTHEELMNMNGKYAQMFEIQSHYYKEEVGGEENEEFAL